MAAVPTLAMVGGGGCDQGAVRVAFGHRSRDGRHVVALLGSREDYEIRERKKYSKRLRGIK